jgi:hypothetical protein
MRYLQHENGNLKKNTLNKIKSLCHVDSKHSLRSKIVQVIYEKNTFKVDNFLIRGSVEWGGGGEPKNNQIHG